VVEKNVQDSRRRIWQDAGQLRFGSVRLYPGRVSMVDDDALVASHERLTDRGQPRYDWQHYIPLVQRKPGALRNGAPFADLPPALQQLRQTLLRHAGGDRVMAQVLAAVPSASLDAVLVAIELAPASSASRTVCSMTRISSSVDSRSKASSQLTKVRNAECPRLAA